MDWRQAGLAPELPQPIRASMRFVYDKDRKTVAAVLKPLEQVTGKHAALESFDAPTSSPLGGR